MFVLLVLILYYIVLGVGVLCMLVKFLVNLFNM